MEEQDPVPTPLQAANLPRAVEPPSPAPPPPDWPSREWPFVTFCFSAYA